jgi:hypothetical protein
MRLMPDSDSESIYIGLTDSGSEAVDHLVKMLVGRFTGTITLHCSQGAVAGWDILTRHKANAGAKGAGS